LAATRGGDGSGSDAGDVHVLGESFTKDAVTSTTALSSDGAAAPIVGGDIAMASPASAVEGVPSAVTTPCVNPQLGYTVQLPTGWREVGAGGPFAPCQVLGTRSLRNVRDVTQVMRDATLVFTSIVEEFDGGPDKFVAGSPALVFDETLEREDGGGYGYSYAIDRGASLLVASLRLPMGTARSARLAMKKTLDNMMATLALAPLVCRDSFEPLCGAFYFEPEPAANAPLELAVTVSPTEAHPGEPVHFKVTARDADADLVRPVSICFAGPSQNCIDVLGVQLARTGSSFLPRARAFGKRDGSAYGPWAPPPRADSGVQVFEFDHAYEAVGDYVPQIFFESVNTHVRSGRDPYRSSASPTVKVTIR
jgi:hypothetical protein